MTPQMLLGIVLVACPFVAVGVLTWVMEGWFGFLFVFGGAALVIAAIWGGIHLIATA